MLFVCLAHFTNSYFFLNGEDAIGNHLVAIGMLASPTFVTVSGLVAGFLFVTRRNSFAHLRRKLIDRGLFLLIVGHLILALSGIAAGDGFAHAYRVEYITDAIAFAIIVGPWLITVVSPNRRLLLAALIFVVDWCFVLLWTPGEGTGTVVKDYLIGVVGAERGEPGGGFPALPWTAVYLAGTVLGERIGALYMTNRHAAAHLLLARIGLASVGIGLGVKTMLIVLRRTVPLFAQSHPTSIGLLSFYQKFPPGPVYLCFFGGAGVMLVAAVLETDRRQIQRLMLNQLRQIGAASFFVYIVQFYLYAVGLHFLRLPYTRFWPLLFLLSIVVLVLVARRWNAIGGNRFLTVGFASFLAARALRRRVESRP